jgi:RNA polymerase sigma factor (sigma-70 family)
MKSKGYTTYWRKLLKHVKEIVARANDDDISIRRDTLNAVRSAFYLIAQDCWIVCGTEYGYDLIDREVTDPAKYARVKQDGLTCVLKYLRLHCEAHALLREIQHAEREALKKDEEPAQAALLAFAAMAVHVGSATRGAILKDTTLPAAYRTRAQNSLSERAYCGISLRRAKRLRKRLELVNSNPHQALRDTLPKVMPAMILDVDQPDYARLVSTISHYLDQTLPALDKTEKVKVQPLIDERIASPVDTQAERKAFVAGVEKAMVNAVPALTERQWIVSWLNVVDGLTLQEIAQRLSVTVGTAASHLARAKEKIKQGASPK